MMGVEKELRSESPVGVESDLALRTNNCKSRMIHIVSIFIKTFSDLHLFIQILAPFHMLNIILWISFDPLQTMHFQPYC